MRKLIIILITLFFTTISINIYSQNNDTSRFKKVVITTTLSDYIPGLFYQTINFNLGAEIYIKNRKSIWFNLGALKRYQSSGWFFGELYSPYTMGFKAQGEGRYYLNKHKVFEPAVLLFWPHIFQFDSQELENSGYYVAIHSSFNRVHYRYDFTCWNKDGISYVNTLNIKFGYQCVKKIGLTVDFAIGIGGRYIYSNPNSNPNEGCLDYPYNFWDLFITPRDGFSPNAVFQFRLGWAF